MADKDSLPVKKEDGNLAISPEIQALLKESAKEELSNESKGLSNISLKGKKFSVGDIKLGTELSVVILADCYDYAWYDTPYKDDVINSPACFAIGQDEAMLAPHESSPKPQSETCEVCDYNQYGSASNGNGKACRNGRRLLVAPYMDGAVDLTNLGIISMAPTSLKPYSKYKRTVLQLTELPIYVSATKLSFDDDKAYPVLNFNYIAGLTDIDIINSIMANVAAYKEMVSVPYNVTLYKEAEPSTTNKSKLS